MIIKAGENVADRFCVRDPVLSDHFAVSCTLKLCKVLFERKRLCYRKLKSIEVSELQTDIGNSPLIHEEVEDVTILVDQYNSVLSSLLDKHAPLNKRVVTLQPAAPWYNDEIKVEKCLCRRLEQCWRVVVLCMLIRVIL